MSSAGDRLVGTFMQPYAEPLSWSGGRKRESCFAPISYSLSLTPKQKVASYGIHGFQRLGDRKPGNVSRQLDEVVQGGREQRRAVTQVVELTPVV
jgi:hypothetical protein